MIWDTWKLLPQDTRIAVRAGAELSPLEKGNAQKILNASKQQIYRYKTGVNRLTVEQFNKLGFDWSNHIDSVGLAASEHSFRLPEKIPLTEALAWLIGFHSTESSETPKGFGICNTELSFLVSTLKTLTEELNIAKEIIRVEVRWPENQEASILVNKVIMSMHLGSKQITTKRIESKYKPLFTLRVNSRLIKDVMQRLESDFNSQAIRLPSRVQGAYLRGIFDADGWFNTAKKIVVLAQAKKEPVDLVCKLLKSLGISFWEGYWKYRGYYVCSVHYGRRGENLKKFMRCVGFSHPKKREKINGSIVGSCRS